MLNCTISLRPIIGLLTISSATFLVAPASSQTQPLAPEHSKIRTLQRIKIAAHDAPSLAQKLLSQGFDVLESTINAKSFDAIVNQSDINQLQIQSIPYTHLATGRPFADIQRERQAAHQLHNIIQDVPDGYLNLSEILDEMQLAADTFPDICKLVDLTTTYNAPETVEGRHLFAIKISDNVNLDEDEPATLIVSNHHARELVTPVIALHAIAQLTSEYGNDPDITDAVDHNEIWIAPTWNPDGYEYVFTTNNMWRKNRRHNGDDIYGVDLNRNYPFLWDTPCSGSTKPDSQVYKGTEPASEAETQTMVAWSNAENFAKVIDFHSSGRETLWAYSCSDHPLATWLQAEAIALSDAGSYDGKERPPSAEGEHYQYQLGINGAHAFLIETHEEFQPEYTSAQAEAAQLFPAVLWMLNREIPIAGKITNADTGLPINNVAVTVDGIAYENDEGNHSEANFGRFEVFLPEDEYQLEFNAPGYATEVARGVEVVNGSPVELAIELVQLGITLDASPLIAGQNANFVVADSIPNTETYLAYSIRGLGQTFIPFLDITLDLRAPKQAGSMAVADSNGTVIWDLPIPTNTLGRTIWLQAAQYQNTSNTIERTIE